jgi:hypothetical protein
MRSTIIGAALFLAGTSAFAAPPPKSTPAVAPAKATESAKKTPDFDLGQVMAIFDKIFPPQPDPLPSRLALSRTSVQGLFPNGTYARMMGGMMHGVVDRVMAMSEADFGGKGGKGKPADTMTLRQKLAKDDPYFDERMKITERVITEEFGKMSAIIEPKLREGLARSMARRFDEKQLSDINAFLATDSGRAFGSQSMAMWIDTDVMRSMMSSFPEMMKAMPEALKRVETETAHLPKPKKAAKPAKSAKGE